MALYQECAEYFDQALASPKGIAVELETRGQATNFMQKMNQFRVNQRKQSKKIYDAEHPMYGKSPWEELILRYDKDHENVILIQPAKLTIKKVREL